MNLKIKKEFSELIPPLTSEEYIQLEKNCIADGIRDRIITWDGFIVDGHNRYKIAQDNKLNFQTEEVAFENENEVILWIIENQLGRRNITEGARYLLFQKKKETLLEVGKSKISKVQTARHSGVSLSTMDKDIKHNTRKEIAKDLGWSETKVARADKVWKKADEETKQKVVKGDITFNEAYHEIKTKDKKKEIEKQKEEIKSGVAKLPEGRFEIIVMDVPWGYGSSYNSVGRRSANPYPDMTIEEIKNIKVPASDNSILWFWTTQKFLKDSFDIVKHYGFEYKGLIVWDKEKMGMGDWLRMQTEFCLMCIKGKPIWDANDVRDIIRESRREHSRKPDQFYEIINKYCVGRKLDYFSRAKRDGWENFGNQSNKF